MFEDESEILAFVEEAGLGARLDFFDEGCARGLCFEPRHELQPTAIKKGGLPDLPAAIDWPVRAAYPNCTVLAEKFAGRRPEVTDALQEPRPCCSKSGSLTCGRVSGRHPLLRHARGRPEAAQFRAGARHLSADLSRGAGRVPAFQLCPRDNQVLGHR